MPAWDIAALAGSRMGPPKGILFSGPSGTGKTVMAKAFAGELGQTLIVVDPPTLLSKWVGESEKGLREVFKRAKQVSPCILLIDDIDAIAVARTEEHVTSVAQRVTSQLFRELDELQGSLGVTVLAATNRIDLIEPALLRAGRLDYVMEFKLPERDEREEILRIYLRTFPLDSGVDIGRLADISEGWSGADLEALCQKALMLALQECMASGKSANMADCLINSKHFDEAVGQQTLTTDRSPSIKH
jgi:transitional endoplasmic reticulum ATPase